MTGGSVVPYPGGGNPGLGGRPVAAGSDRDQLGGNLELGELEQLTITNDNESSYDVGFYPRLIKREGYSVCKFCFLYA